MGKSTETEEQTEFPTVEDTGGEQTGSKDAPPVTGEQSKPAETGLTIQDLTTALQIITVVQARGAIKADEMTVVGALYTKLQNFLKAAGALEDTGKDDEKDNKGQ